jgi:histidine triad (HIT) family protein
MGCCGSKKKHFEEALLTSSMCVFCQKISYITSKNTYGNFFDERQVLKVGELVAIVTHQPLCDGHLLVVPLRHTNELDAKVHGQDMVLIEKKIGDVYKTLYGPKTGYITLRKTGWSAGQTVPHYHTHFYPRMEDSSDTGFQLKFFLDGCCGCPSGRDDVQNNIMRWRKYFERQAKLNEKDEKQ